VCRAQSAVTAEHRHDMAVVSRLNPLKGGVERQGGGGKVYRSSGYQRSEAGDVFGSRALVLAMCIATCLVASLLKWAVMLTRRPLWGRMSYVHLCALDMC
jgi:hypothetical protein